MKHLLIILSLLIVTEQDYAQQAPQPGENIGYLTTYGKNAPKEKGDDDYCQIFFVVIPSSEKKPFYIRVFDPNVGGTIDDQTGEWNTLTKFSVYGGKGAFTNPDAREVDPKGSYDSGNLLQARFLETANAMITIGIPLALSTHLKVNMLNPTVAKCSKSLPKVRKVMMAMCTNILLARR